MCHTVEHLCLDTGGIGGEYIGAVGHLVSAVMQTAGLYAQASVLVTAGPLLERFGALIYCYAIMGAVISVALFGNYRQASYLIIGPALFHFMINTRTPARATLIRLGGNVSVSANYEKQIELLTVFLGRDTFFDEQGQEKIPNVSWFFAEWDHLVSDIVQGTATVLVNDNNLLDVKNVARERAYANLFQQEIAEPGYLRLLALGAMGQCAELMAIQMEISKAERALEIENNKQPPNPQVVATYEAEINQLQTNYDKLKGQVRIVLDQNIKEFLSSTETAIGTLNNLHGNVLPLLPSPLPITPSCEDIWEYISTSTQTQALLRIHDASEGGAMREINNQYVPGSQAAIASQTLDEVVTMVGGDQNPALAVHRLATQLFKNSLEQSAQGLFVARMFNRQQFDQDEKEIILENAAMHEGRGAHLKILHFAGSIPYIQGLLLYLLTLTFPFFAVLLLVPGKATSFFVWASLWVWVKSWDLGFAFLYFVRDLLWQYMNKDAFYRSNTTNWSDPSSIYTIVSQSDPLSHLNTYYQIIALLTVSVPLLTAHLCLGASGMFEAFRNSIDKTGDRFAQQKTNASRGLEATVREKVRRDAEEQMVRSRVAQMEAENERLYGDKYGMTADGRMRRDLDSGTRQRYQERMAAQARFEMAYHNKDRVKMLAQDSALRGRRMDYNTSMSQELINAKVNDMTEQFEAQSATGGHTFFGGDRHAVGSNSINIFGGQNPTQQGDAEGD